MIQSMKKQLILNLSITALREQQVDIWICKRKEFCKVRIFLPVSSNTLPPIQSSPGKVTAFLVPCFIKLHLGITETETIFDVKGMVKIGYINIHLMIHLLDVLNNCRYYL